MTTSGGPAFPTHGNAPGITKLDYFAAHALPSLIQQYDGKESPANITFLAYNYAQAMLAESKRVRGADE